MVRFARSSWPTSLRAVRFRNLPFEARQIWPPADGLLSTIVTRAYFNAATAAARPAGPSPTPTISGVTLFIWRDLHTFFDYYRAASSVRYAVDRNAAFEAGPHSAQRPTRFS